MKSNLKMYKASKNLPSIAFLRSPSLLYAYTGVNSDRGHYQHRKETKGLLS